MPVLLAPVAYQKLIHPDGELESVRGANAAGVTFIASTSATTSVEDIANEATVAPWFQLYGSNDRTFTKDLVDRARESGCTVLCFTVDAPVRGQRDRDTRVGFRLPPGIERPNFRDLTPQALAGNPRAEGRSIYSPNLDPKLTWEYFDWLRSVAKMPILLKGLVTAEDAARAVDAGVDGIVVSNHGGRVIDTVTPGIEALPEIVEALAAAFHSSSTAEFGVALMSLRQSRWGPPPFSSGVLISTRWRSRAPKAFASASIYSIGRSKWPWPRAGVRPLHPLIAVS